MRNTETVLFKNLKFGVHVKQYDSILPYPASDALIRICDEADLLNLQSYVDGNLEVVIDRSKPWYERFTVPAWSDKTKDYHIMKAQTLKGWNTTV